MAIKSGKLRHRVSIQAQVKTQDPVDGSEVITWQEVKKVWASVEPLSAREFIAAQATQSQVTARIAMRYWSGLEPTMRIVHRNNVYNIRGVLPDANSGLEHITLPVSAGVDDGA